MTNGALANCDTLKEVIFTDGTSKIPDYICASDDYRSNIERVVIPDSVIEIGSYAFYKCDSMVIYCSVDSYAETYAKQNNIPYALMGSGNVGSDGSKIVMRATAKFKVGTSTSAKDRLTARVEPPIKNGGEITWSSSNPDIVELSGPLSIAGVSDLTSDTVWCNLKCKAVGTSIITASNANGASATCLVTVVEDDVPMPNNSYGVTNNNNTSASGGSSARGEDELKRAVDSYYSAVDTYEREVINYLKNYQIPQASNDDAYEAIKGDIAARIMNAGNDDMKEACCKAVFYAIRDMAFSDPALEKIDMSADEISISTKTIKEIADSFIDIHKTYSIDQYEVTVNLNGLGSTETMYGFLNIRSKKGIGVSQPVVFSPDIKNTADIMSKYLNQLKKMEENALNEAVISTLDYFTETVGLDKYIKSKFTNIIDKYAPQLNSKNLGEIVSFVDDCKTSANEVKKIMAVKDWNYAAVYDEVKSLSALSKVGNVDRLSNKIANAAYKNVQRWRNKMIEAAQNYINNTHEPNLWEKIFGYKCPVDIIVYDSLGNEIGSVIGDEITCSSDDIMIEKIGDTRYVYTKNGIEISYKIIATDYGLLNVMVEDYEDGIAIGRQNFYNIPLDLGDEFTTSKVSDKIENMIIYTSDGERIADEYISSNDDACVDIQVVADGNGYVINEGEYAKGDEVKLTAVPDDGYKFAGWYNDEELLSSDLIYSFNATEDLTLKALFILPKDENNMSGDIDGDGQITSTDANLALFKSAGIRDLSETQFAAADVDHDGKITSTDANFILFASAGLRELQ